MYNAWVGLRKKTGNALIRQFWKKPDPNDNSHIASFRSRMPEKMQTRRKNKNDQSNYMKLKLLRKEIFSGREILGDVMEREKLKLAQLDLDYMELKQMIKEKVEPSYQCEEFKEFVKNENERTQVELPKPLAPPNRPEDNDMDVEMEMPSSPSRSMKSRASKDQSKKEPPEDKSSNWGPGSSASDYQVPDTAPKTTPKPSEKPTPKSALSQEKVVVDPTTVTEIAVMFKKLHYFGIQYDRNRIKISTHKPIKKEDYLNLPQHKVEEEQYYRSGIKPKSVEIEKEKKQPSVKY